MREEGAGSHKLLRGQKDGAEWRLLIDPWVAVGVRDLGELVRKVGCGNGQVPGVGTLPGGSFMRTQPRAL